MRNDKHTDERQADCAEGRGIVFGGWRGMKKVVILQISYEPEK